MGLRLLLLLLRLLLLLLLLSLLLLAGCCSVSGALGRQSVTPGDTALRTLYGG